MLLQALVVGRSLIESCRTQAQHKLEAVTSRSYTQYREPGMVLRPRPKRNGPKWNTVYDTQLSQRRLMGTSSRMLASTPQSPYHRPASRYEPFDERNTSSESAKQRLRQIHFDEADFVDTKWTPVYRFPRINVTATISRAKFVQTTICIGVALGSFYYYSTGDVTVEQLTMFNIVAIVSTLMLYVLSSYSRRLVGVASVSKCGTWMRVGHTDFWGRRCNVICPLEDVVPWSETDPAPNQLYGTFSRYSDASQALLMPTAHGCVVDEALFVSAFGNEALDWVKQRAATVSEVDKKNQ